MDYALNGKDTVQQQELTLRMIENGGFALRALSIADPDARLNVAKFDDIGLDPLPEPITLVVVDPARSIGEVITGQGGKALVYMAHAFVEGKNAMVAVFR